MSNEEPRLLFVHIPKTAGISLFAALRDCIGSSRSIRFAYGNKQDQDQYLAMSDEKLRSFRLISGHLSLPFFLRRPVHDYRIVTLVREPVDRELSAYFYMKTWKEHPHHAVVGPMDLYEYLDYRKTQLRNRQCWALCETVESFAHAKKVIDESCFLCAPSEYATEFYEELIRRLGLNCQPLKKHNATDFRLRAHEIHPDIKKGFEDLCPEDMALYEYVKRKFETEVLAKRGSPDAGVS